ncbi:MAG: glycosyltransferase, partial [Actinobacteria bacterium]|nr:glycosyltransferase [Actinomycetota bacterium]
MRIGIVCPYSWDIPGGVQTHVRDLAEKLMSLGHHVSVLAPGDDDIPGRPPYVVVAGKTVPIPYNGSVARVQFGLVSAARVRRWLRDGDFDVVHVHEPAPPSLSLLACMIHDGPLVATFHMATARSRFLSTFDSVLQPFLEKISGRIAVSPAARKVIVEHLGGDADGFRADLPAAVAPRVELLGQVSDEDKARLLSSVDVYCAPNTGQE